MKRKRFEEILLRGYIDAQLNISNIKVQYQVSGFITRCTVIDIKFATLVNLSERAGCAMTFYLCEEGILQYSNVFNASSQNSFSLLMFGQGSHVNISNCVFQLNDYDSIIDFYTANNEEIINYLKLDDYEKKRILKNGIWQVNISKQ